MFYFLTQVTSVRITTTNSALASHAIVKSSKADVPSVNPSSMQSLCYTLPPTLHHSYSRNLPCHSCILNHIGSNSLMETAWQLKSIPYRKLCIFWINRSTNKMLLISQDAGASKRLWAAQARDYDLQFTISWRKLQKHHTIGCIQLLIVYIMDHARQASKIFPKLFCSRYIHEAAGNRFVFVTSHPGKESPENNWSRLSPYVPLNSKVYSN